MNWTHVGPNAPTYTITSTTTADTGFYRVVVSNSLGSATSKLAYLKVTLTNFLAIQPGGGGGIISGSSSTMANQDAAIPDGTFLPTVPAPMDWQFAKFWAAAPTGWSDFHETTTPGHDASEMSNPVAAFLTRSDLFADDWWLGSVLDRHNSF
jgi:hypothetical protein